MGWRCHDLDPRLRKRVEQALHDADKTIAQVQKECPNPHECILAPKLQSPEPECHQAPALGAAVQGKAKGDDRVIVRFIGYRVRLLDPDNFAGGTKDVLDGLRHAGLIPGDEPDKIVFVTEQRKVKHRGEERTEIELLG